MQAFKLDKPLASPRKLSQSVLQITQILGMYQAELARILGYQCREIGKLASGQQCLQKETYAWQQAVDFIAVYQALYELFQGDSAHMYHWLRSHNDDLSGTPHLLMVDDLRVADVLALLQVLTGKHCQ